VANLLMQWRVYQARRRGKGLHKDVRRMLARAGSDVDASARAQVEATLTALQSANLSGNPQDIAAACNAVADAADRHLLALQKPAWRESAESIGVAVCVALVLRSFIFEAFKIPSGSMIPSLSIGDQIFVNKYIYGVRVPFTTMRLVDFQAPKRGEVVVFVCPIEPHEDYIKRVIGLPGDEIAVRQGVISINGVPVPRRALGRQMHYDRDAAGDTWRAFEANAYEEHLGEHTYTTLEDVEPFRRARDFGPITVPPNHVLAMGDNRDHSYDSRAWGTVPQHSILGRSMFVWWSYGNDGIAYRRIGTWID
jgi:signal peptidase I